MTYDINTALERLERNLSEVASARKQVEETVATSESLQQIIDQYSVSLSSTNGEISKFVDEVNKYQNQMIIETESAMDKLAASCQEIVNLFQEEVRTSTDSFNMKFTETIVSLKAENTRLAEYVDNLISVKDALSKAINEMERKVDSLAKDIKDSQNKQDATLTNIKSAQNALSASMKSQLNTSTSNIIAHVSELQTVSNEIDIKIASSNEKIDKIILALNTANTSCEDIKSEIGNLKGLMDIHLVAMGKGINVNRYITIIGIILLVILFLVKFF